MWLTRALDHSKRVICIKPNSMGGPVPDDVIDSAGILRPEWEMAPSGKWGSLAAHLHNPSNRLLAVRV